jgi:hypothetical protein
MRSSLLGRCCKQRPEERATADELMAHPFLATACNAARLSGAAFPAGYCSAFNVYSRYFEAFEQAEVVKCYTLLRLLMFGN